MLRMSGGTSPQSNFACASKALGRVQHLALLIKKSLGPSLRNSLVQESLDAPARVAMRGRTLHAR